MNFKEFLTGYKGKDIPKELNDFNWGAFLLTFIWGWKYKAWITFLAIPLIFIQLPLGVNWILFVVLQFYCGFKGNEWAYQVEYWKKPVDFRKTQAAWAISAVSLSIVIPFTLVSILLRFINKSEDNLMNYSQSMQCYCANHELKTYLSKILITPASTDSETAQRFAKISHGTIDRNTVTITKKGGLKIDFNFAKISENPCSLAEKNCIINAVYNFGLPDNIFKTCTFYFDQNKQFVPDEETREYLERGINILKYL